MRPTRAFALLLLAWGGLGALCAFSLVPLSAWQLAGVAIVLAAAVDAARLWRVPDPVARRELAHIVPVGVEREATVYLQAADAHAQRLEVHDLLPGDWATTGLPRAVELHPGSELALAYRFVPGERGSFEIHLTGAVVQRLQGLNLDPGVTQSRHPGGIRIEDFPELRWAHGRFAHFMIPEKGDELQIGQLPQHLEVVHFLGQHQQLERGDVLQRRDIGDRGEVE